MCKYICTLSNSGLEVSHCFLQNYHYVHQQKQTLIVMLNLIEIFVTLNEK